MLSGLLKRWRSRGEETKQALESSGSDSDREATLLTRINVLNPGLVVRNLESHEAMAPITDFKTFYEQFPSLDALFTAYLCARILEGETLMEEYYLPRLPEQMVARHQLSRDRFAIHLKAHGDYVRTSSEPLDLTSIAMRLDRPSIGIYHSRRDEEKAALEVTIKAIVAEQKPDNQSVANWLDDMLSLVRSIAAIDRRIAYLIAAGERGQELTINGGQTIDSAIEEANAAKIRYSCLLYILSGYLEETLHAERDADLSRFRDVLLRLVTSMEVEELLS